MHLSRRIGLLFALAALSATANGLFGASAFRVIATIDGQECEALRAEGDSIIFRSLQGGAEIALSAKQTHWGAIGVRFEGAPPLEPRFAWLSPDFEIRRSVATTAASGPRERSYRIDAPPDPFAQVKPWSDEVRASSIPVYGWAHDGKIVAAGICRPASLELSEEDVGGALFLWLARDGAAAPRAFGDPLEAALFSAKADLSALASRVDPLGNTLAHYAAMAGRDDLAAAFSKNSINARDRVGHTPLTLAAMNGRAGLARKLLEMGAKPNYQFDVGQNAMMFAIRNGHTAVVDALLPVTKSKSASDMVLTAVARGYADIVDLLLDSGMRLSVSSHRDELLVVQAAFANGRPEIGFRLLEALRIAPARFQHLDSSPFHGAASYGDAGILDRLRDYGLEPDRISKDGLRPLDVAVATGNVEAICWFVDHGGAAKLPSPSGLDPVGVAAEKGSADTLQCLLGYGFDASRPDQTGLTPLMKAVSIGRADIARLLIGAGATWNFESPESERLVARALAFDEPDLVEGLFAQGLAPDATLFATWSLREAAAFYECSKSMPLFALPAAGASAEMAFWHFEEEELPAIDYPRALQREFGDATVRARLAVDATGRVRLVKFLSACPPRLRTHLEQALVDSWRFDGARPEGARAGPFAFRATLRMRSEVVGKPVLDISELTSPPELVYEGGRDALTKFHDEYGWAVVRYLVNENGAVDDVEFVELTDSDMAEAILHCLRQAIFKPGEYHGRPVRCYVQQRWMFGEPRVPAFQR